MPRKLDYSAPIDDSTVGHRLRALRQNRGLTQIQLSKSIGMDQSLLSRYERGELRIHAALLASLARVLGTSTDDIVGLRPGKAQNGAKVADQRLVRRMAEIDKLPKRKKQALLTTIDAFLDQQRD